MLADQSRQIAVVQGLVMDRVQSIRGGDMVFQQRCCRLSYGVLCSEAYNASNPHHLGQNVIVDPLDGKRWVPNQIQWFVKQVGQPSAESYDPC